MCTAGATQGAPLRERRKKERLRPWAGLTVVMIRADRLSASSAEMAYVLPAGMLSRVLSPLMPLILCSMLAWHLGACQVGFEHGWCENRCLTPYKGKHWQISCTAPAWPCSTAGQASAPAHDAARAPGMSLNSRRAHSPKHASGTRMLPNLWQAASRGGH